MAESTEVSVASSYTVVYELSGREWTVMGNGGWSEVHLYRDEVDGTHRIVGWTVNDQEVLLNCNVTLHCNYKQKSPDFHKFMDEHEKAFGLGFHKGAQAAQQAKRFMECVKEVIQMDKNGGEAVASPSASTKPAAPAAGKKTENTYDLSAANDGPRGKLPILPPKPARTQTARVDGDAAHITDPYSVIHQSHVSYDPKSGSYSGLPPEWRKELCQQFELEPNQVETTAVEGYTGRIPNVLLQMKDTLFSMNGHQVVGIFRLAPDSDACKFVKQQLEEGTFEKCQDVNVLANLIKVWFRNLPTPIMQSIDPAKLETIDTPEDAGRLYYELHDPYLSCYLWLLDLSVDISAYSDTNKMTAQNLAIVISPNLFNAEKMEMNPMEAMMFSQKVAHFMFKSIEYRRRELNR